MGTISTVMDKGLVVIPKEIREQMGLKKGDKVAFVKLGKHVSLVPVSDDPIRDGYGMLKGWSMAEYLEEKRRDLEEEEKDLLPPRSER